MSSDPAETHSEGAKARGERRLDDAYQAYLVAARGLGVDLAMRDRSIDALGGLG